MGSASIARRVIALSGKWSTAAMTGTQSVARVRLASEAAIAARAHSPPTDRQYHHLVPSGARITEQAAMVELI
jgi:hypothetical protein